ncbi:hypothetical protein KYG70_20270 [Mycobacterium avium subsp. paratuberculosis]|uniref:Uncharacterized protein n=1 Tax=Mycolicibacterium paratuberculosis (strain ATCC BAA-968 / K-10) TaxID=262316 RepID=Q73T61_MYCPA|nr:hypothetical protein [Mycobacterium avium]ETB26797.1 hypothetical protein O977_23010 [Mycobacterium avium subsp. paratuberculosis 10-5975]AAS06408.1 hypothetical protein MAP_3858 [Mycobacterium avium subsp. paratuberculosis K-10]AGL38816.1 hypothetical protein MAP4_3973 [Mycobacterium avium subsp. paratuberculosis MAP4]MBD3688080.1 hypothetical protein [Mycobacterium avium subsp. paratuberculosis]MBD3694084.1 hypothetical protein [Mycobacterium avium subsp. paratuberculosis]
MHCCARLLAIVACLLACVTACSNPHPAARPYGAQGARLGESLALLGWNMSVSNLRWDGDYVLVDVDASPASAKGPHAKPEDIRFGLYGALAHPMEATGLGSCDSTTTSLHDVPAPLSAPPDRLTGTVCLGPLKDRSQVRGVYGYSPRDRIPNSSSAYPVAFPVGLLPTNPNDSGGLAVKTASLSAWRADGTPVTKAQLGDPGAFTGNGYMLLGLEATAVAARYRDESVQRGGPMMLLASPTLPGRGLNPACAAYGSSVLILPDASLDAVHVNASLCTQGEINDALLYATLAIDGTHAGVWTQR